MQSKVSIFGAGPSGFALAADLESRGTHVLIYSHPSHLRQAKSIIRNGTVKAACFGDSPIILRVTCDMAEAVRFSNIIILTVPSTAQETIWQELKEYSLQQHTLIAMPGNLLSLVVDADLDVNTILETNLSPYSCRINEGNLVVSGKKKSCSIAPLRRLYNGQFKDKLEAILPLRLHWRSNIIEVSLTNINGVFHPLMVLMNVGWIESTDGAFRFYHDGLTRSVANAIEAVDRVRIAIGAALGFHLPSVVEESNACYGQTFTDLVDLARHSTPHKDLQAPSSIDNRTISEDVADVLVCWHGFAQILDIDASPIMAVIILASMASGVDYMQTGRGLAKVGLKSVTRSELIQRFGAPSPP